MNVLTTENACLGYVLNVESAFHVANTFTTISKRCGLSPPGGNVHWSRETLIDGQKNTDTHTIYTLPLHLEAIKLLKAGCSP